MSGFNSVNQGFLGGGGSSGPGPATTVPISGLLAAESTNSINNGIYTQTWNWALVGGVSGLVLTSAANSANNSITNGILNVALSGNALLGISNETAAVISNSKNILIGIGYGIIASATGTGAGQTNIGGLFTATGGGANNYALRLVDGTELNGRVLTCDDDGNANWAEPTGVTGSGTLNYVPKWSSGSALGNSSIQDNGTNVSVGANLIATTNATYDIGTSAGVNAFRDLFLTRRIVTPTIQATNFNDQTNAATAFTIANTTGLVNFAKAVTVATSATTGNDLSITNSTLTTGSAASIALTGTAAASNTKTGLTITSSGANATASQTVTGQTISVTNTGTTNTNVGLNVTASGATTNNAILATGNISVTPTADNQNTFTINATSGNKAFQMGTFPAAPSYGGFWAGNTTPSSTNYTFIGNGTSEAIFNAPTNIDFRLANTGKWSITSTAFVPQADNSLDIGTTSLQARTGYFKTGLISPLFIGGAATTSAITYKTTTGVGTTGADHIFQVGNNGATEAMRILNSGNVGIGTTSPQTLLHIGASSGDQFITFTNSGVGSGKMLWGMTSNDLQARNNGGTTLLTIKQNGQLIVPTSGAASTPPITATGTWFTGGTATTTKPQLLIEPTGATSAGWSTAGTGLGVNAPSGFAGNIVDFQLNGTSFMKVSSAAILTTGGSIISGGNLIASAGNSIYWNGRSQMWSPSDGVITFYNTANTDFTRLNLGGTTTSFPAIARSTTNVIVALADATAGAGLGVGMASATGVNASAIFEASSTTKGVLLPRMTATQGSAITGVNGLLIYVTDTNGTFTSVGFWGYENGAWVKL